MDTVAVKLHNWAMTELNMASEGPSQNIPDAEKFKCLSRSLKHRRIWNYVINHVRSQATVEKVKRTLKLKEYRDSSVNAFIVPSTSMNAENVIVEKIVNAKEKKTCLKKTLSSIEDNIVNVEKQIEKLKDETNKVNQESAFQQLLSTNRNKSAATLKLLAEQISCHFNHLRAFGTYTQPELSLTYPFGCDARVKAIVSVISAIVENKVTNQNTCDKQLHDYLQKKNSELKASGFHLNDLVLCLRDFSDSDRQQFASSILKKSVFLKDLLSKSQERDSARQLVSEMQKDSVYYSLRSIANQSKVSKLLVTKNDVIDTITASLQNGQSNCDVDTKLLLFETVTGNKALVISNEYLEEMLRMVADKTEIFKRNSVGRDNSDFRSNIDSFYKYANATFWLLNTAPETLKKVVDDLSKLQAYASNELFSSEDMMSKDDMLRWKSSCAENMELTCKFSEKLNLIEPLKTQLYGFSDSLTPEARKLLNIEVFENVATLCRKVLDLKKVLQVAAEIHSKPFVNDYEASDIHSSIPEILSECETLTGTVPKIVNEGKNYFSEIQDLVKEWWEQDAQFVPEIEHEGKSLKMWNDILCFLVDFEPQVRE